ncbi:MAG: COX15/CtaA family protein [Gammaproteobacteria bacterium]|nr:COX15/CtaA family protein [Gammaproteobacteria bacterium]
MNQDDRIVANWLTCVCVIIFCIVIAGGVTRLTHSGLSMVDWQPILGVVPPLSEAAWQSAFDAYKQYPEYQKVNRDMQLPEFKIIYYWEYVHRLLGRLAGIVFLIPFIILLYMKKIRTELAPHLVIAFILGGCQGLLGWYMVKSGLIDIPRVSHYRLAAHLMLALFLLAYLSWLILGLRQIKPQPVNRTMRSLILVMALVLGIQLVYGAFVAGLRAGIGFNSFPLMNGRFLAEAATMMTPGWLNLVENGAMVQFLHRWLGFLLLVIAIAGAVFTVKSQSAEQLKIGWIVLATVMTLQFVLGVSTLLMHVPLVLASLHQVGAVLVILCVVYLLYTGRKSQ